MPRRTTRIGLGEVIMEHAAIEQEETITAAVSSRLLQKQYVWGAARPNVHRIIKAIQIYLGVAVELLNNPDLDYTKINRSAGARASVVMESDREVIGHFLLPDQENDLPDTPQEVPMGNSSEVAGILEYAYHIDEWRCKTGILSSQPIAVSTDVLSKRFMAQADNPNEQARIFSRTDDVWNTDQPMSLTFARTSSESSLYTAAGYIRAINWSGSVLVPAGCDLIVTHGPIMNLNGARPTPNGGKIWASVMQYWSHDLASLLAFL